MFPINHTGCNTAPAYATAPAHLHLCDPQDNLHLPPLPPPPARMHSHSCPNHTHSIHVCSAKYMRGPERVI